MDKDVVEQGSDVRCILEPDLTMRAQHIFFSFVSRLLRILKQYIFSSQLTTRNGFFISDVVVVVIVLLFPALVTYFAVFPSNQLAVHVRHRLKGDRNVIVANPAKGAIRLVDREATILAHVLLLEANNIAPDAYLEVCF